MFSKFKPFAGPEEYSWKDPDTGRLFKEPSKKALIERIVLYRSQNNLETIDHLDAVLENYWCGRPENRGKCVPTVMERGFLGYVKGGVGLIKRMVYNSFVDQATADNRAAICLKCPRMIWPDKGPFIKWSDDIAEASTLGRRSKFHDELGSCEICTCVMRAKIWMGGTIPLEPEWVEPMTKAHCWQIPVGRAKKK